MCSTCAYIVAIKHLPMVLHVAEGYICMHIYPLAIHIDILPARADFVFKYFCMCTIVHTSVFAIYKDPAHAYVVTRTTGVGANSFTLF